MPVRARSYLGLVLLAAIGTGPGCGGGGGGSPSMPTAAPSGAPASTPQSLVSLDGTWRGSSAQGSPISFVVRNARLVSLTTRWTGQGGGGCSQTSEHSMDVQIFTGGSTLGRFTHTQHDLEFFQGIFGSPSAASGTFSESIRLPSGATCSSGSVSWTASK